MFDFGASSVLRVKYLRTLCLKTPTRFHRRQFLSYANHEVEEEYNWDPKYEESSRSQEQKQVKDNQHVREAQTQLLTEALQFVPEHGWTARSLAEAAKALNVSPAFMNSFDAFEDAALILFFLDLKMVDLEKFLFNLREEHIREYGRVKINQFVFQSCKEMLSYVIPYLDHWPSALTILAEPSNAMRTFKHHVELVDLIWHYAGDTSLDYNWYSKRILLSGVINSTQLHLIQDKSENYEDTWTFLDNRLKDVASIGMGINNFRKSLQELGSLTDVAFETGRNMTGVPCSRR
ncbi:ubiquinone biosynthesis protein COQ9, mitochondrial-like [Convolutriloba macropyga]|uniref:ubiquinone biosynthesis protein COQ9, mitochondrial-like n=1 Tax=Convolutriloba macropyga TaxID=536237 RepID=UPI003F51E44C